MDWLLAQLLAISIGVGLTITDKFMVGRVNINAYILLIGTMGLLTLFLFPITGARMLTTTEWLVGVALGVLFCFIIYATFRAFAQEEVSRLAPLGILSTVFISIGAGLFFGEHLTGKQYVAFALFLVGALVLAIRIDKKMVLLYDLTNFRIDRIGKRAANDALRAIHDPGRATRNFTKDVQNNFRYTVAVWNELWGNILEYTPWKTKVVKQKTKLRLIRGLGWYLLVITLNIPFTLLLKNYNMHVGTLSGYIAVRTGLFAGSVLLALGHWEHIVSFVKQTKLFVVASVKEVFGITATYLGFLAAATGPLAIVQSMGAIGSVGVLVAATILTQIGVLHESMKRRDIVQKAFGVLCIAIATVLLFT